jgi:hypothetical protein
VGQGLVEFSTIKAGPGQINFIEYLEKFLDYNTSPYVRIEMPITIP